MCIECKMLILLLTNPLLPVPNFGFRLCQEDFQVLDEPVFFCVAQFKKTI